MLAQHQTWQCFSVLNKVLPRQGCSVDAVYICYDYSCYNHLHVFRFQIGHSCFVLELVASL